MTNKTIIVLFLAYLLQSVTLTDGFSFQAALTSLTGAFSSSRSSIPSNDGTTIPSNVRLLILPGFGNDAKDYCLETLKPLKNKRDDTIVTDGLLEAGSLVRNLHKRGWTRSQIKVLSVQRSDWLQVFWAGAMDPLLWQGTMPPTRPAFRWYLSRVAEEINELTSDNDDHVKVVLVCHSAGGWLARAALGFGSLCDDKDVTTENSKKQQQRQQQSSLPSIRINLDKVLGMVTLGSPHLPPPAHVMDMTRGALRITHETFPGAHHVDDNIFYISIIGESVTGVQQLRGGNNNKSNTTKLQGFAFNSYEAVCGDGTTIGDGVVPTCAAHLDGATQQITLPGVFHSINAPTQWYGSDAVIDSWHDAMLQEIRQSIAQRGSLSSQTSNLIGQWFR